MPFYLSYLMGAPKIDDAELERLGIEIVEQTETRSRKLKVPGGSLAQYEQLIVAKLDNGFWNDLVSEDDIVFIFKLKDGTIKRFVFAKENEKEIAKLCSELNGDPLEKTSNLLNYLVGNGFYEDTVRKYHFKHLSRKWAACGGLFFNKEGNLLIVKPTYRPDWLVVGGNIEEHQSPLETFIRETKEEIGLTVVTAKLLHVQYITDLDFRGDRVQFIFDGGMLSDKEIASIKLQKNELSEYKFVETAEALKLLDKLLAERVANALKAKEENVLSYSERKAS